MTTSQKIGETLKRIGSAAGYFYKYYQSFRTKYDTGTSIKLALQRTAIFLGQIPQIWRS